MVLSCRAVGRAPLGISLTDASSERALGPACLSSSSFSSVSAPRFSSSCPISLTCLLVLFHQSDLKPPRIHRESIAWMGHTKSFKIPGSCVMWESRVGSTAEIRVQIYCFHNSELEARRGLISTLSQSDDFPWPMFWGWGGAKPAGRGG